MCEEPWQGWYGWQGADVYCHQDTSLGGQKAWQTQPGGGQCPEIQPWQEPVVLKTVKWVSME